MSNQQRSRYNSTMPTERRGRPRVKKPAEGTVRVQIRLPTALFDEVEAAAEKDDRSRDQWIRRAIEAALGRK